MQKKRRINNDGNLTLNVKIFEGSTPIFKITGKPLSMGLANTNFFATKKLNVKRKGGKRGTSTR